MAVLLTPMSLVNSETGEILDEFNAGDKISVQRSSQIEYVKTHIQNFNADKSFIKIYDDVVPLLEKHLTNPEFKFVIILSPHVSYEDCIIRETTNRKSKILGISDIAEIHGYTYDYAKKIMASLKRKGVIGKHDSGSILPGVTESKTVYTVNPYIYFRGNNINTAIYSFYENSGWKELLSGEIIKE